MKVKLHVKERLLLLTGLLPISSLVKMKIVREMKEDLSFDNDEIKQCKISDLGNGQVHWERDCEKEFDFNETQVGIIKESLVQLDQKQMVTEDHLPLFEMFDVAP